MADKKITELPAVALAGIQPGTDVIPIVTASDGITKKATISDAVLAAVASITTGVTSVNSRTGNVVLTSTDVGLANANNTSDANKPVSTAQQTALNTKQDTLVSGTNVKTINSVSIVGAGNISTVGTITRSARTSNIVLGSGDLSTFIDITSGTFTQTFTAVATLGAGWWVYIRNSGTGDITLDPNAAELIDGLTSYVMYPGEVRLVQCDGSALRTIIEQPFYRAFTASATFTKPPGYSLFEGMAWGAGGGGGNASAGNAGGGGGAAGLPFDLLATSVGTTETITIAAASAAQAAGGNSTFGSLATGFGGAAAAATAGGGGSGVLGLASGTTGGSPRSGNTDQDFGGGDGNAAKASVYGGGGGGGVGGTSTGGASLYGGGGGGEGTAGVAGVGGASKFGGSGGTGTLTGTAGTGVAGSAPGGGGGGGDTGGAGGRGEIRVWGVV